MKLEEFRVYQDVLEKGEKVWKIVTESNFFAKDTKENSWSDQQIRWPPT